MKKFIFLLLLIVIGSGDFITKPVSAQPTDPPDPGAIYLYVEDEDEDPVLFARVFLIDVVTNKVILESSTGVTGTCVLALIPPGTYKIRVLKTAYIEETTPFFILLPNMQIILEVVLRQ